MRNLKNIGMGVLLAGIAVVGPLVAYAGVSVVYPSSTQTVALDTTPPITFAAGADQSQAQSIGFLSALTTADNAASFSITLKGLSGGAVTIDDYATITKAASVTSYKMSIATALSAGVTTPTLLKIRLYTGGTAPTADNSAGVCGVLDLQAAQDTESAACTGTTVHIQLLYTLPTGSSGTSTVAIRPSSIVFA